MPTISRLWRWIRFIGFAEAVIVLFSIAAMGRRRPGAERNSIARLFLDEPGWLESLLFYVVMFHVLCALLFAAARWSVVRKRKRLAAPSPD